MALVAAIGAAVLIGVAEDVKDDVLSPWGRLDELKPADWLWIAALSAVAFAVGLLLPARREALGLRGYRAVGVYWRHALNLLLMADAGLITPTLDEPPEKEVNVSGQVSEFWLEVPGENMTERLDCEVRLSLWAARDNRVQIIWGPRHPAAELQFSVDAAESWIAKKTRRWARTWQESAPTIDDIWDEKRVDKVLPVFDLEGLEASDESDDVDQFVSWGYRSLLAVPVKIGDIQAWIVALSMQPQVFGVAEKRYMRYLSISLGFASRRAAT